VGLDRSHVAAIIPASASVITLVMTAVVIATGSSPLMLSGAMPLGVCLTNLAMLNVAVRLLRRDVGGAPRRVPGSRGLHGSPRLLAGSGAMLLVSIGLPVGLQSGRLLLSHTTDLDTVAEYAVGAQFYGIAWGVLSAAGMALWPAFVRLRSEPGDSLRQWQSATVSFAAFGGVSACALGVLAPAASRLLTGGHVHTDAGLAWAFGLLLFVQALHLPTGMMLTRPNELRWQAACVLAMALAAVLGAAVLAPALGAVAVPLSAGLAILVCQVVPDQTMTRTLLARRGWPAADD
jgi:O-antigen/teichoic acid export membrane protein